MGSALTTASASQVRMINGGQSCNIFWQIGSSATMGTGSRFLGNVLASSSVTMTTGTSSTGRLVALNGAVTLDGSTVTVCALALGNASLSKSFSPSSINLGGSSRLTVTLINPNPTVATLSAAKRQYNLWRHRGAERNWGWKHTQFGRRGYDSGERLLFG